MSTMDSAAGTIVIPETVEKIDDYALVVMIKLHVLSLLMVMLN